MARVSFIIVVLPAFDILHSAERTISTSERVQSASLSSMWPVAVQEIAMGNTAQPRPVLVLEMGRDSPTTTTAELTERAQHYVNCGAHALALQTCNEDGSTNLGDLFAVVRSVRVPVLQSDWFLHPIQVNDCAANMQKTLSLCGAIMIVQNSHAIICCQTMNLVSRAQSKRCSKPWTACEVHCRWLCIGPYASILLATAGTV